MNRVCLICIWCFLDFIKARSTMTATATTTDATTTSIPVATTRITTERPKITTSFTTDTNDSTADLTATTTTDPSILSTLQPPVSTSTTTPTMLPMTTSRPGPTTETTAETPTTTKYARPTTEQPGITTSSTTDTNDSTADLTATTTTDPIIPSTLQPPVSTSTITSTMEPMTTSRPVLTTETTAETPTTTNMITEYARPTTEQPGITTSSTTDTNDSTADLTATTTTDPIIPSTLQPPVSTSTITSTMEPMTTSRPVLTTETTAETPTTTNMITDYARITTERQRITTSSTTYTNDSTADLAATTTTDPIIPSTLQPPVSTRTATSTTLPMTTSRPGPTTETTTETPTTTNMITDISISAKVQPWLLFTNEKGPDGQIYKKPKLLLRCQLSGDMTYDLYYTISWYVNDIFLLSKGPVVLSNINYTNLFEHELIERGHRLDINIKCVVSTSNINGGFDTNNTTASPQFWLGIRVLNPTVQIIQGKKATIQLQPTFPIGCSSRAGDINVQVRCLFSIYMFDPDDSNTCESNSISIQESQTCGIEIPGFYYHQWTEGARYDNVIDMIITTKDKTDYHPGRSIFVLKLLTGGTGSNDIINGNYLSDTTVTSALVTAWQAKICYSYVDPHMRSFDGRYYENQNLGVFVMYRHKSSKQEVQMKTKQCNSVATCACAVAVRAGGDIFLIDLCRSPGIINHVSCKENILNVRQISPYLYQIYMPLGTLLSVTIHNWWGYESTLSFDIYPSVRDVHETQGLCGVLNDNEGDDFMTPSGYIEMDNNLFSKSWSIDDAKSYFHPLNHDLDLSQMWNQGSLFCVCPAAFNSTTPPFCSPSLYSTCSKQTDLYGTPYQTCNSRTKRSRQSLSREIERILNRRVIDADIKTHNLEKRSTLSITFEESLDECTHFFNINCTTSSFENSLPNSNHDIKNSSIRNCALDYMYTGDMSLASLHCETYRSQVDEEVRRNSTFREENPHVVESFRAMACINNCNNHGNCMNGSCICHDPYIEEDCSVSLRDYPAVEDTYAGGLCQKNTDVCCGEMPIYGSRFVKGVTKQKLERFQIYINGTMLAEEPTVDDLPILNPFEAEIIVPCKINRRSISTDNSSIPFVTGTRVSLTNDGTNYGSTQIYYIYDSQCQGVLNSTDGYTFYLLNGTCFIGDTCYIEGEKDASDSCRRCISSVDRYSWANGCIRSDTDTPRSTASITNIGPIFAFALFIAFWIAGINI